MTAKTATGIHRINAGTGHWYKVDGRKSDGVTTLIKNGRPNHNLIGWAARETAEYVADNPDVVEALREAGRPALVGALSKIHTGVLQAAGRRGTKVHKAAEKLIIGEEVEYDDEIAGHVEAYIQFLDEWRVNPILVECIVASRTWGYTGTTDIVADIVTPGDITPTIAPWLTETIPAGTKLRAILDPKSNRTAVYPDAAYQLAAYRYADVYVDPVTEAEVPMAELGIEFAAVVHVRADGYDVHPMDAGPDTFKTFQHLATVARRVSDDAALVGGRVYPKENDQ
jgi:hypothetical protein